MTSEATRRRTVLDRSRLKLRDFSIKVETFYLKSFFHIHWQGTSKELSKNTFFPEAGITLTVGLREKLYCK